MPSRGSKAIRSGIKWALTWAFRWAGTGLNRRPCGFQPRGIARTVRASPDPICSDGSSIRPSRNLTILSAWEECPRECPDERRWVGSRRAGEPLRVVEERLHGELGGAEQRRAWELLGVERDRRGLVEEGAFREESLELGLVVGEQVGEQAAEHDPVRVEHVDETGEPSRQMVDDGRGGGAGGGVVSGGADHLTGGDGEVVGT